MINGDKVAVDALLEHPDIAAVSFVGSTPIAKYVYETATANGKRCQALGGAKNHMIVLPDADIDMAADAAVSAAYGSAGERCMAVSLLVAVGDVADPLVEAIKQRIPNVKVGDGMDAASEMGPLITREHRDKVASYIGADEGATVVVDGRDGCPDDGFFLAPTLIDGVTPGMKAYEDEIFGPVLSVTRVSTYDEAVRLVNENPYGNGTAIFTRDGGAARQFQFEVQAGMVGINVPIPVPVAYYSFGGWKASLFGDRHIYGPGGHRLLHPHEGRHVALAGPGHVEGRSRFPADALAGQRVCGLQFLAELRALDELAAARLGEQLVALDDHVAAQQDDLRRAVHLGALEDVDVRGGVVRLGRDGGAPLGVEDDDVGVAADRDRPLLRIHPEELRRDWWRAARPCGSA